MLTLQKITQKNYKMKKIFTTAVALLVMGSVSIAQDAAKKNSDKKMEKKEVKTTTTESKMDSKDGKKETKKTESKKTETKKLKLRSNSFQFVFKNNKSSILEDLLFWLISVEFLKYGAITRY